jgi:hypothetical protein
MNEEVHNKESSVTEPAIPKAASSSNSPTPQDVSQQNTAEHAIENLEKPPTIITYPRPTDLGFELLLRQHLLNAISGKMDRR